MWEHIGLYTPGTWVLDERLSEALVKSIYIIHVD